MTKYKEIKRYAKMFVTAVGIDGIPAAVNELQTIQGLMSRSREFRTFLENPLFGAEEREKVMRDLSQKGTLSENTVRLILRLSEQRIIAGLPELIDNVTALYLEKKKKARALVMTPVDLDRSYEERLRASLRNLTGRDADIEYVTDPSLLGGILIKVGSTMYDSSIKGQLRLLKDDLTKG